MPDPKGKLVTPVGIDAAGNLWALLVDAGGRLQIDVVAMPATAVTIADGADVTLGALADAVVAAGAAGSISAKLRRLTTDLDALLTELQLKANLTDTQPISAAALPLPLGAATYAMQDNIVTALGMLLSPDHAIYNVTMTLANTEYSQLLNYRVKKLTVKCRTNYAVQLCFTALGSDTLYITIPPGQNYWEDNLYIDAPTLYFQCATAAQVLEIIAWA